MIKGNFNLLIRVINLLDKLDKLTINLIVKYYLTLELPKWAK